jgi:hypothetical protein
MCGSSSETDPVFQSINPSLYDPKHVLESEEFEILTDPNQVKAYSDADKNIACCYNDKQQVCFFYVVISMLPSTKTFR